MKKRKAPTTGGINSFFKPVGSTSSSNITGAENVIPSEEQPVADNQTNDILVDILVGRPSKGVTLLLLLWCHSLPGFSLTGSPLLLCFFPSFSATCIDFLLLFRC